jgi:hypothetical protein
MRSTGSTDRLLCARCRTLTACAAAWTGSGPADQIPGGAGVQRQPDGRGVLKADDREGSASDPVESGGNLRRRDLVAGLRD